MKHFAMDINEERRLHEGLTVKQYDALTKINHLLQNTDDIRKFIRNNKSEDFKLGAEMYASRSIKMGQSMESLERQFNEDGPVNVSVWKLAIRANNSEAVAEGDLMPVIATTKQQAAIYANGQLYSNGSLSSPSDFENFYRQHLHDTNINNVDLHTAIISALINVAKANTKLPKEGKRGNKPYDSFSELYNRWYSLNLSLNNTDNNPKKKNISNQEIEKDKKELADLEARLKQGYSLISEYLCGKLNLFKYKENPKSNVLLQLPKQMAIDMTVLSSELQVPYLDISKEININECKENKDTKINPSNVKQILDSANIYTSSLTNLTLAKKNKRTNTGNQDINKQNRDLIKGINSKIDEITRMISSVESDFDEKVLFKPKYKDFSSLPRLMSRIARINNFACTGKWYCTECGSVMTNKHFCNSCGFSDQADIEDNTEELDM